MAEQDKKSTEKTREAGMMVIAGVQGVGKTFQNMQTISQYVKDNPKTKVRGRKCLIFDTNGEYTPDMFSKNGIEGFKITRIALGDVEQWSRTENQECRRIDAKNLGIADKKTAVEYLLKVYRNGMLVLEDINTYILSVTFMEDIVGGLVNLRHRAVDVMISYQSLRPVEPRIWQNSRWVKMFYQADDIMDIKGKVTNLTLFKIAQLLVNTRYFNGDKRFFVYIHSFANKVTGSFSKREFEEACKKYLALNKKYVKSFREVSNCSEEEAIDGLVSQYVKQYHDN